MSKLTIFVALLVLGSSSAISPSDIFSLLQHPEVATMAKDYVVNTLAGPISDLRNSVCSSPLLHDDNIAGTLNRAADSVTSAISDATNLAPKLQDALSFVTSATKNVMANPNFKPQMEALQKQLEHTLDFLGEHFEGALDTASKAAEGVMNNKK